LPNSATQNLAQRIVVDDETAYQIAFKKYYRLLVICAYQILKGENSSKDAVQEVFLEL